MRRIALALLVLLSGVAPAFASTQEGDATFTIHGEVRARAEYLDNTFDFVDETDPADFFDDTYDLWPYRVRIAAEGRFGAHVSALVELQNFGYFGNEPPFKSPGHPIFQGLEVADFDDTNLYQGFVELHNIGGYGIGVKVGRQEHTLGNELQMGDADFYTGLSYDGVRGSWKGDRIGADVFYYMLSELNGGCIGFCGSDNTDFSGVTFSVPLGENGSMIEPYLLLFRSQGDIDPFFLDNTTFFTLGGRWSQAVTNPEDHRFDWNIELAIQDGDIGPAGAEDDHKAWLGEAWLGYNWGNESSRHRVHVGALISSGDKEDAGGLLADGEHEDYLFLFPDFHAHNRLGDSDLELLFFSFADASFGAFFSSGVTNVNVGWEYFGDRHGFMASYHQFMLTEENCVLTISGGCEDDLGSEIDARYNFGYTEHVDFEIGVADFMPGDAVEDSILLFGGEDDAMRIWAQARLRW